MRHRHLFGEWEVIEPKTKTIKKMWSTKSVHLLSKVCSLQLLRSGVVGWGCSRLINLIAGQKKAAESAALALPPAVAVLRTRPEGDKELTISFHTAVLHQVTAHYYVS